MLAAVTRNKSDTRRSDGYQSFNPSAELYGNAVRALNGPGAPSARSTFPNWNGLDQKRLITSLTADELKCTNPAASVGGTAELVWKRVK
jgi:hypothetical protein